jgi:hypothetical protein
MHGHGRGARRFVSAATAATAVSVVFVAIVVAVVSVVSVAIVVAVIVWGITAARHCARSLLAEWPREPGLWVCSRAVVRSVRNRHTAIYTPRTFAVPSCTRRRKSTAAGPSLNVSRAWTERGLQKKDWRWLLAAQSELAILCRSRLGRLQKYKLCSRIERPARQSTGVGRSGWRVRPVSNACQQRARLVKGDVVCTGKASHEDIEGH